jgi:O-antigen biosynthesis protein WbqP
MYQRFFKRFLAVGLSVIGGIALLPLFLALMLAVKLDSPGPVFFKQKRVGIHESTFYLRKFRTMRADAPSDTPTHMLADPHQYITRTGRFLRKFSLDELPQIYFNILPGHMAIVGPRPALWNQFDLIEERDQYGANDVRPGLTGWAQINGRDELPIPEKARLDGEYVGCLDFGMDVRCFFGTVINVFKGAGVVEGRMGAATEQESTVVVYETECEKVNV